MSTKREHAEHNEQLCDTLISLKDYNDWVITTAFYSSLHYVVSKLFPLTTDGITYNTVDNYYTATSDIIKNSKHQKLIALVVKHLPAIGGRYRSLFDMCMNARYHNYNIPNRKANKAKENLEEIKKTCTC